MTSLHLQLKMKVALLPSQRSQLNDGKNDESEVEQCVVNGGTSAALRVRSLRMWLAFFLVGSRKGRFPHFCQHLCQVPKAVPIPLWAHYN